MPDRDAPNTQTREAQASDESSSRDANDSDRHGSDVPAGVQTLGPDSIKVDARRAAVGGVLAGSAALVGGWFVGAASGVEARVLLESSLPSLRSFCGTLTLALGNILALMLTLLSMSAGSSVELRHDHYQRVKQIALIDTVVLVGAVLAYLLLNVPLSEADRGNVLYFEVLYYGALVVSSLLAGALISIALMLFNAVRDIIHAVAPDQDSPLVRSAE